MSLMSLMSLVSLSRSSKVALVLAALVAGQVCAQEIGTEITPTTPNSGVQQQPQNDPPPANPDPPRTGYVYKPKGSDNGSSSSGSSTPTFTGTKVSASSGDFGIRAGFGTQSTPSIPAGAGTSVAAPSVGIAYFGGDAFKLLFDVGFGILINNSSTPFALNASIGFDYLFRTPGDAMRPFFHAAGFFDMRSAGSGIAIGFGAQLGFGAEYFFAPSFSVNARLLLAVPMSVSNGFAIGVFTFTPGVGATWYL